MASNSYTSHLSLINENEDGVEPVRRNSTSNRLSRNSTGCKEEFVAARADEVPDTPNAKNDGKELMIVFVLMVFVGLV